MIHLPEGVREQLKEYEKQRKGELPTELVDKLFRRDTWGEAIKELQIFLCEDPYSMNILWEQLNVEIVTETWMIMPELEELLTAESKILQFKSLFDIDSVDYEQTWYMGWIFPGYTEINENLPEKTTLHRKLKEYLLSGKKFGIAKGHLVMSRVYEVV